MAYFLLRKVTFTLVGSTGTHAGETTTYTVQVRSTVPSSMARVLHIDCGHTSRRVELMSTQPITLRFELIEHRRGKATIPEFTIRTTQPFGIWRLSARWRPHPSHWVYPRPLEDRTAAAVSEGHGTGSGSIQPAGDTVGSLRPYEPGDSPRRIAWRAFARSDGRTLASKYLEDERATTAVWLDFDAALARSSNPEEAYSRLAAWIIEASRTGRVFGLLLPGQTIAMGSSQTHLTSCLQALAAHGHA